MITSRSSEQPTLTSSAKRSSQRAGHLLRDGEEDDAERREQERTLLPASTRTSAHSREYHRQSSHPPEMVQGSRNLQSTSQFVEQTLDAPSISDLLDIHFPLDDAPLELTPAKRAYFLCLLDLNIAKCRVRLGEIMQRIAVVESRYAERDSNNDGADIVSLNHSNGLLEEESRLSRRKRPSDASWEMETQQSRHVRSAKIPRMLLSLETAATPAASLPLPTGRMLLPSTQDRYVPTNIETRPISIPVAASHDRFTLTPYQALVRQSVEFFTAGEEDVALPGRGRRKKMLLGQVGVRCKHCSHVPVKERQSCSQSFPGRLWGVYQAAQSVVRLHILEGPCQHAPSEVKEELERQRGQATASQGCGKVYWEECCRKVGLHERREERGIWLYKNFRRTDDETPTKYPEPPKTK